MAARFRRAARLPDEPAFKRVFEQPQRIGGAGYVVLVRPNDRESARIGLAIAKRCAKRAVDRNRLKRVARESFRLNASRLPPVDIVVLCARGAPGLPNRRLRATLELAWKTIRSQPWAVSSSGSSESTNI